MLLNYVDNRIIFFGIYWIIMFNLANLLLVS
jgi:hypothetical protein